MKTWKNKVNIPQYGLCEVKEASDKESKYGIAPISHGFVNLYQNGKWIDFCGVDYARKYIDMPIIGKINEVRIKYKQNNLTDPNELWVGEVERFQLEQYIKSQKLLTIRDCSLKIKKSEKMEFMGLKVRFNKWARSSSFLEVDYNPWYD